MNLKRKIFHVLQKIRFKVQFNSDVFGEFAVVTILLVSDRVTTLDLTDILTISSVHGMKATLFSFNAPQHLLLLQKTPETPVSQMHQKHPSHRCVRKHLLHVKKHLLQVSSPSKYKKHVP